MASASVRLDAVLAMFSDMGVTELTAWVERGWVQPDSANGEQWVFRDIDVARVRLIHDLRRDLDVAEDAVPLVLTLLDEVYELRTTLRGVIRAVGAQPPEVRKAVLGALDPPAQDDDTPPQH
jgi:chaperone modulatory protein CbpM